MRFLSLLSLFLINSTSALTHWSGFEGCGTYKVQGVAQSSKKGVLIVVNDKTQSEFEVAIPIENEVRLAPYIDQAIVAEVLINTPPKGSKIQGLIKTIKSRLPNPINPADTGMRLISKDKCE